MEQSVQMGAEGEDPLFLKQLEYINSVESGSVDQLDRLLDVLIYPNDGRIVYGPFRTAYLRLLVSKNVNISAHDIEQDLVLSVFAYIIGRRERPVLPEGYSDEKFISNLLGRIAINEDNNK